eukprot:3290981-Rhodomonas_salina.2
MLRRAEIMIADAAADAAAHPERMGRMKRSGNTNRRMSRLRQDHLSVGHAQRWQLTCLRRRNRYK